MNLNRSLQSLKIAVGAEPSPAEVSRKRAGPAKLLLLGYLAYITIGWMMLSFGFSQSKPLSPLDTLFTAVSAVSTTGLTTIDTGTSYTFAGQIIVMLLIQFGGIGYMTGSSFLFLSFRHRLSKTQKQTAQTAYSLPDSISPKLFIRSVILFTAACETAGAIALYAILKASGDPAPLWSAIFHSVSAFCTAGFSLNQSSFSSQASNVGLNLTVSVLSIVGAMGFIVIVDTVRRVAGRSRHFGFTSKVIARMTLSLLAAGTLLIFVSDMTLGALPAWQRLQAAFFQAMSASTTVGFNTVNIGGLPDSTIVVLLVLMFIGASPAGTGGGLKTTSFAALIGLVRSTLKGRSSVRFFKRQVTPAQLQAATTSLACYGGVLCAAVFLLCLSDPGHPFETVLFEAVSAIGTVGLSMGLTGDLSAIGKLIIIGLMIVGRLGVLTFGLAIAVPDESLEEEADNDLAV
ncbi:potassium transporter KtrB [Jiella sp. MQZ9-1]|uniref:Potassium transporter KtrB n=1 Tax=Jiella flava TaxID=2816857 RepID=A0A939FWW9_9HYPH|nr:potassium transporter TrkG [Jiella flava]MBO0661736.1 potassium transporter KtrB [Jiella flava]MCD2470377.1 potassium transporter KtrB [Jiella flava]